MADHLAVIQAVKTELWQCNLENDSALASIANNLSSAVIAQNDIERQRNWIVAIGTTIHSPQSMAPSSWLKISEMPSSFATQNHLQISPVTAMDVDNMFQPQVAPSITFLAGTKPTWLFLSQT
jgi:hypothetical protein